MSIKSQYLAFELSPVESTQLLADIPVEPKFKKKMMQHVTVEFNLTDESAALLQEELRDAELRVVGSQSGDGVDCLAVDVNGSDKRPDGKTYHITMSLADGHKPVESNKLLAAQGYQSCVPVRFTAELKLLNK